MWLSKALFAARVSVDTTSRMMPFIDCIYHEEGNPTMNVTSDKNPSHGCHHLGITLNADRITGVNTAVLRQEREVRRLPNCPNDQIGRYNMLGAREVIEIWAAVFKTG